MEGGGTGGWAGPLTTPGPAMLALPLLPSAPEPWPPSCRHEPLRGRSIGLQGRQSAKARAPPGAHGVVAVLVDGDEEDARVGLKHVLRAVAVVHVVVHDGHAAQPVRGHGVRRSDGHVVEDAELQGGGRGREGRGGEGRGREGHGRTVRGAGGDGQERRHCCGSSRQQSAPALPLALGPMAAGLGPGRLRGVLEDRPTRPMTKHPKFNSQAQARPACLHMPKPPALHPARFAGP